MTTWISGVELGPYELLAKIGEGGMGEVWKARDTRLNRIVAIKRLKGEHGARFQQEARAIAALNHPHICQIHDIGSDYLVLEYIEGAPLRGPLALDEAVHLGIQIAGALEAAHAKGILHRDLKPGNIMMTASGAKLLDFGLAKLTADGDATLTIGVSGTPLYMSPEQAEGKVLDVRSDIFSFGAALYELLAGHRAFDSLAAVLRDDAKPLSSPAWEIVCLCLAKEPQRRFQTIQEVRAALEQVRMKPTAEQQPSIAVLPFANLSGDKEQEYFSDGLAEEILNALAQIPGLKVIARTSSFAFRGKEQDIRKIAEALDVGTVLEGSVRRAGSRIRVTAQLINARDGSHLWSERYDRELSDVFAIQDEISQAIAAALKAKLSGRGRVAALPKRPTTPEAYRTYLEARYHLQQATSAGMQCALDCLERVIRIDPAYAPAYAALAERIYFEAIYLSARPREVVPAAFAALERALRIDPEDSAALALRGAFRAFYEHNWTAAGEDLERAIEVDPGNSRAYVLRSAWHLVPLGRFEEAVTDIRRAVDLDPLSVSTRNAEVWINYAAGRNEKALADARRLTQLFPGHWTTCNVAAIVLRGTGLLDEALAALERGRELNPGNPNLLGSLALIRGSQGQTGLARSLCAEVEQAAGRVYVPLHILSLAHEGCGDLDSAYRMMSNALDEREPMALLFLLGRRAEMDSDPRYQALLRKIGLS